MNSGQKRVFLKQRVRDFTKLILANDINNSLLDYFHSRRDRYQSTVFGSFQYGHVIASLFHSILGYFKNNVKQLMYTVHGVYTYTVCTLYLHINPFRSIVFCWKFLSRLKFAVLIGLRRLIYHNQLSWLILQLRAVLCQILRTFS